MTTRILQIVPTLDRAGTEKQMALLVAGLPRHEFDVHVCALACRGPLLGDLEAAGVKVTALGRRWPLDPQALWRLKQLVSRLRPDLIHAWLRAAGICGYAVARACGVKHLVVNHHRADCRGGWLQRLVDRHLASHSDRVVVHSPAARDACLRDGLPADKLRVIPRGVAPAEPFAATRRQWLAELGLPADSRLIGLVGRLLPRKRIKDAIWAADLLKVIRDDVHLLVIGEGPDRQRLLRFREQVVIRDKVHFLGDRGDVPRLLPHCDLFWSTSGREGQSSAILEAMAAGVPVVATDIPGTRELVAAGETGYLVPVGDRAAFARHTNKLLDDADLARRLGQAGRERAQREFSLLSMIERYRDLYREVAR